MPTFLSLIFALLGTLRSAAWLEEAPVPPTSPPRVATLPAPRSSWLASVQTRIANDSRAIHAEEGGVGFVAALHGPVARFGLSGVSVSESGDEALSLSTSAWGRPDGLIAFGPGEPAFGDCTDDLDPMGECVRRLEYVDAGVTECWVGLGDGLEQAWIVDEAPEGDGALTIVVDVGGAIEVTGVDGGGARITDGSGREWGVSAVVAWDADGTLLPATMGVDGDSLLVSVDDSMAVYPVTVDPVYTTASWTAVGDAGNPFLGGQVVEAGDVNGDGYADLLVGQNVDDVSGTSHAWVYEGSPAGLGTEATTDLTGTASDDEFADVMSGAGDVNGDGYDDVVVHAFTCATSSTGCVYVYEGSAAGISSTIAATISGESGAQAFGGAIAPAGDVNGDGFDDLVVGAPAYTRATGQVFVYLGSADGLAETYATALTGEAESSAFGSAVSGAGDVNGDGFDDLVIGANGYASSVGRAYLYSGSSSGVSEPAALTIDGESVADQFGIAVSGIGDANGDGYGDVAVGANGYRSETGGVYVYSGSVDGLDDAAWTMLTGEVSSGQFGEALAAAGDTNGDGYDDVLVGAYACSAKTGRAYVFDGSASGVSTTAAITLYGAATNDYFGKTVAGGGDHDGDGYDDVVVGALGFGTGGQVTVYAGSSTGVSLATTIDGVIGEAMATSVAGAGDVNGDGYQDVIVGASAWSDYTGRAYLYIGSADGLGTDVTTTLAGLSARSWFGSSVHTAGDVDGDGYDDVVVGAFGNGELSGAAYLYAGSASGLSSAASAALTEGASDEEFGYAVAGAGDVNGDGYDDLLVGAPGYSSSVGRVYLYSGSSAGLSSSAAATLDGDSTSTSPALFGAALDRAGDVNADGYDDVIIGAYGQADYAGRAGVYPGSATGLSTTAMITLEGESAGYFGHAVAGAGDINGDGYDDVMVGGPKASSSDNGRVTVYNGSASGPLSEPTTTINGGTTSNCMGATVASAGDINGDGYADIVAGGLSTCSRGGHAWVYEGTAGGLASSTEVTLASEAAGDDFAAGVAGAGDVNGDGYGDIVVGAPGYDGGGGKVYAYYGYGVNVDSDGDGVNQGPDCDDDDATSGAATTVYLDADGDGFGDPASATTGCLGGAYTADASDCDDAAERVNSSAVEVCDGVDNDCDGLTDDPSAADTIVFYADTDNDTYGDLESTTAACAAPDGYVSDTTDCDDTNAVAYPGAPELCGDGVDEDCDTTEVCYVDADGDGYRSDDATTVASENLDCSNAGEASDSTPTGDCDDANAAVSPVGTETAGDGIDQDCDGSDTPADSGGDDTSADDTGDSPADDTGEQDKTGCGCASASDTSLGMLGLLLPAALLIGRRLRVV